MIYNDPNPETGFLLNVDPKWTSHPETNNNSINNSNRNNNNNTVDCDSNEYLKGLYCLAICHRHDIRSLRVWKAFHNERKQ